MSKEKKQLFKEVPVERLKTIFNYCKDTGKLLQNGSEINNKLNEDNNFSLWYMVDKKQYKVQAIEIAYALTTGKYSKFKVRTKDLDNSNLKLNNLIEVTYEQDKTIRCALLNLRKYLKVKPTDFDQNRYVVRLYNEIQISKRFESAEGAAAFVRKSKLIFMKSLERCGIDINSPLLY